jgi:hypothetical protein
MSGPKGAERMSKKKRQLGLSVFVPLTGPTSTHRRRPGVQAGDIRGSRSGGRDASDRDGLPGLAWFDLAVGPTADKRQDFFADAVRLFEVRGAGKDERVDASA